MNFPKRGEIAQRVLDMTRPQYAREPVSKPQITAPNDECPKCGKRVGRGRYMHIKNCKGA
jgi:hypothetical protein